MTRLRRRGFAFAAGQKREPIQLVNGGLRLVNQIDRAVFSDLEYGGSPHYNRRVIIPITAEENTGGDIEITGGTLGGVPLTQVFTSGPGAYGQFAMIGRMWQAIVPTGSRGDLVLNLSKTASATANIDSICISTLVTNAASGDLANKRVFGNFNADPRTISNLHTSDPGFLIGFGWAANSGPAFASFVGNASNGALTKLVDVNVANDHRHAVWLLDDTAASTTEDYTCDRGTIDLWGAALVSWRY